MYISEVTFRHQADFHFIAVCRSCQKTSRWGDGYADDYYQARVFPARHCPHCGLNEMGEQRALAPSPEALALVFRIRNAVDIRDLPGGAQDIVYGSTPKEAAIGIDRFAAEAVARERNANVQSDIPLIAIAHAALQQAEHHCSSQDPSKHPWQKLSDLQAEYVEHALSAVQEEAVAREREEIRRLRDALVSARWRLAKGRVLWNGPCHECDAALERGLTGKDVRSQASDMELAVLDAARPAEPPGSVSDGNML